MNSRIYVVTDSQYKVERLVRANGKGQALRHVFIARIASQQDLERLLSRGVRVEESIAVMPDPIEPIALQMESSPSA